MRIQLLSLMLFLVSSQGCRQEHISDSTTQRVAYNFAPIDTLANRWIKEGYYPGASIVIGSGREIIYEKYYGSYTEGTEVYVASAGKWMAAATIATLVDQNKLRWDDPVKKYLPEFNDIKGEATLKQLLSHTSGYPDYQPEGKHPDNYQSLKEAVGNIVDLPADTTPGTIFKYGGLAMQVAGRMAEIVTGEDWETIFQKNLAIPLNMESTHFTPVDTTQGHNPMLAGGLKTTLKDYANFLMMISNNGSFHDKPVISPESVKEMQSDQVLEANIPKDDYVLKVRSADHKSIYGLGEWREELDSAGNPVLISSPGWAGAYPWIDKTTNTWGFFLAHVIVPQAKKEGFSSFLSSPVLPYIMRDIINKSQLPEYVKQGYVEFEHTKLYYEEAGEGEPLILIHGHSFDNSEWDPQFLNLSRNFRVIRYDCRGYGRSSNPVEGEEFLHANDLVTLMDSLNIDKAHLVGLSMGGFIVTDMIAIHEDRILSAVAASGDIFPVPGPSEPWDESSIQIRHDKIEKLKETGIFGHKIAWYSGLIKNGASDDKSVHQKIWEMIYRWDAWQPFHVEPRLVLGNDVKDILLQKEIHVPVMILTGEKDADIPNMLLPYLPNAKQVILPNSGHVSNLENPDGFYKAILKFIKDQK